MFNMTKIQDGECPIEHLTIYSKIRQLVEFGILQEQDTYHPGIENGTCYTYKGNKIQLISGVTGEPQWHHEYGSVYFDRPHDVVIDPVTNKMLAFAIS